MASDEMREFFLSFLHAKHTLKALCQQGTTGQSILRIFSFTPYKSLESLGKIILLKNEQGTANTTNSKKII